jgi:hypothetical protein
MENTGGEETTLWERLRPQFAQAGDMARQVCAAILRIAACGIVLWGNMEYPCARCRRTCLNHEMHYLPELAPHRFCTECYAIIRLEQATADMEQHEYQVVQRQLIRAMENGCEATLTVRQWLVTLNDHQRRCAYCPDGAGAYEVLEHLIPISQGGGTTVDNCLPACFSCNARKRDRHPDDIRAYADSITRAGDYLSRRKLSELGAVSPSPALPPARPSPVSGLA